MTDTSTVFPQMQELHVANDLLGDRDALDRAWERDGYWFFRDVLDKAAIERFRRFFLVELIDLGVIAAEDSEARYNGAALDNFPWRMEPMAERKIYQHLVKEPGIASFFEALLQDKLFWVPTVEYRATPPSQRLDQPVFDYIHEDGVYNHGIPFRICWIPLSVIDAEVGGLALAEGLHRGPTLHRKVDGLYPPIELAAIPDGAWRRATYRPGDVLLMDIRTPHSGVVNRSDRFRLSMDIRLCAASDNVPIVGHVVSISADNITVRNEDEERTARIDANTFTRDLNSQRVTPEDLASFFSVGSKVILGTENDMATVLRPPH